MARALATKGTAPAGGVSIPLDTPMGKALILDAARFNEGLITEAEFRSDWRFSEAEWLGIEGNAPFLAAVQRLLRERIEDGTAAQEVARFNAPEVAKGLVAIATSELMSPRHRIEAARELRAVGTPPKDGPVPGQHFSLILNLSNGKVLRYGEAAREHLDENPDDTDGDEPRASLPPRLINGHALASTTLREADDVD